MSNVEQIKNLIANHDQILLFHHIRPDGDCLGACFGLASILRANYPDKQVEVIGDSYNLFSYLPMKFGEADLHKQKTLGIVLDVNELKRIEKALILKVCQTLIRIDHHNNSAQGIDLVVDWDDPQASSTCELIVSLINLAKWKWTPTSATFLYLGIYTDTNRFLYDCTTDQTLLAAQMCWCYGAQKNLIHSHMQLQIPQQLRIKGWIMQNYQIYNQLVPYFFMDLSLQQKLAIESPLHANYPNVLANLINYPVWIYFTEEAKDQIRCELRSNGPSVKEIATKWNGGGHVKASGCVLQSSNQIPLFLQDCADLVQKFHQPFAFFKK